MNYKIGKNIKKIRKERKITQKELAEKLNLKNQTTISNYEACKINPSIEILFKMCEIFDCSTNDLLYLD